MGPFCVFPDVNPRVSVLVAAALALAGCTSGSGSGVDTTTQTTPFTLSDTTTASAATTTSTSVVRDMASTTIRLLDGSVLTVVGPAQLTLGGYFYFLEIPGLGSANVYLTQSDPAEMAASESTEFHSDMGDGLKLWVGDREGRPFFMTVEMSGWVAFVHVGWETPPETDFLRSLADQLRGEATDRGVVIPDFDTDTFQVSLHDPDLKNTVEFWTGQCLRERVPGSETVSHPENGEMVRKSGYASWCEPEDDLEVTVSGEDRFVDQVIATLTVTRTQPQASSDSGPVSSISGRLPDGTSYKVEFDPPLSGSDLTGPVAAIVLDLENDPGTREQLGCINQCRAVAIGITTFDRTRSLTSLDEGTFRMSSGDWTMSIDLYQDVLDLWGDETESILTDSIIPIDNQDGLPAFTIQPPLRWATDTEIPVQMEVDYGSFVVRRGCNESSVACSPSRSAQVIPGEEVSAPAPTWNSEIVVTVTEP